MKKSLLLAGIMLLPFFIKAQDSISSTPGCNFIPAYQAYHLASTGYAAKDALLLYTASVILAQSPVKGEFRPNRVFYPDTIHSSVYIPLDAAILARDALQWCSNDTLRQLILRHYETLQKPVEKDRGRQYSPYVQEYSLNAGGTISLLTTFVGKEIAEIFVTNNAGSVLDLIVSDKDGKVLIADKNRPSNCYVSFLPGATGDYKIEIRNHGKKTINCLLMTN